VRSIQPQHFFQEAGHLILNVASKKVLNNLLTIIFDEILKADTGIEIEEENLETEVVEFDLNFNVPKTPFQCNFCSCFVLSHQRAVNHYTENCQEKHEAIVKDSTKE
jgi:hypothetical protein